MKEMIMDPIQIMSGTDNMTHPLYVESVKAVSKSDKKAMHYIKNFLLTVENGRKKIDMSPISKTNGDITKFAQYKAIQEGIGYLKMAKSPLATDLNIILDKVREFQPYYADGYNRKMNMLVVEYEAMVMMLQSSLSLALATITLKESPEGISLGTNNQISSNMKKLIHNTAIELTKKEHKSILEALMKASEAPRDTRVMDKKREVKTEAVATATLLATGTAALLFASQAVGVIKNIITGAINLGISAYYFMANFTKSYLNVVSLVRMIAYSYYNKKVKKILKLEEQINFLKKSVEEIKISRSLSEEQKAEMIKKREAYIEMWTKKCAKLRAEFADVEDVTTDQLHADDQKIRQTEKDSSDEFVLEG